MTKKINKVPYTLNPCKTKIPDNEIKSILRGAEDIVYHGGRNLLAKLLKGSKDKKLLELKLNENPSYGVFHEDTIETITEKIDKLINECYLGIQYDYKLPLLTFEKRGYDIIIDMISDEYLEKIKKAVDINDFCLAEKFRDKNREMIFLMLEKIQKTGDARFIKFLEFWKTIDYKKVNAKIEWVISKLSGK